MKRRVIALLVSGLLVSMSLCGCGKGQMPQAQTETVLAVDMQKAEKGSLVIEQDYVGEVSAQQEVIIYPGASGEVTELAVTAGDVVSEGQLLFKIDDESAQLDLKTAQAGYNQTEANAAKTLGSQEASTVLSEYQNLETLDSNISDKEKLVRNANADVGDAEEDLADAKDDEDDAESAYNKAKKKYNKAKKCAEEYDSLMASESAFSGLTLDQAASMTAGENDENPSQSSIDAAKSILNDLADSNLGASDITTQGLATLKSTKESKDSAYESAKKSTENAEDALTSAQRQADTASRNYNSAVMSKDHAVQSQALNDGEAYEDTKNVVQSQLESSAASVESAKYRLDKYTSYSPIAGRVETVDIEVHDTVNTNTSAMVITNTSNMIVTFKVTEAVRNNLTVGQTVDIYKNGNQCQGVITQIASRLGDNDTMFEIKAAVDGSAGLLTGTTVKVTLDSYNDDSGIVIPYDCLYYSAGEPYIYVAEDGVAQERDVKIGMFNSESVVISEGLSVGETVITSWSGELRNGVKVIDSADTEAVEQLKQQSSGDGSQEGGMPGGGMPGGGPGGM